jgi:hypothetical protein
LIHHATGPTLHHVVELFVHIGFALETNFPFEQQWG